MQHLSVGLIAASGKENEHRLPIHPLHFGRVEQDLRPGIFLEQGYGRHFGISDAELAPQVGGILTRAELVARCDVIMLPKPMVADVAELRDGQILWGWPHCVQDSEMTQLAIDKRLTLIAFEAMNLWGSDGSFKLHVLHKNNEIAGYASVLHALSLVGSTGDYGRRLTAAVIGFGATARGAVTALSALGVNQVDILTQRDTTAVASPIHSARIVQFDRGEADVRPLEVFLEGGNETMPGFLAAHDVIVNCVLQDPLHPMMFLEDEDLPALPSGTLVIDVSCDEGMGFGWARPTTFEEPMFVVGDNVHYYGVDHSPSYLWNSATWEISESLLPHLSTVMAGPEAWKADDTIGRAIEIQDGMIRNPDILAFQSRAAEYPFEIRA
ncbi:N(5)-(carboxyethyl)ornithine synthase [Pedococcus bigeumensis]|nr:N(5)-(carboxyethyl)ornithine synthase [Pedococcus bigeumensis]